MPTVKAGDILKRAAQTLLDESGVRWQPSEMLQMLSDGQREIVALRPSAHSKNEVVRLRSGTRQQLPNDGNVLIECVRAMGEDGESPGRAVRPVPRDTIDAARPDWHAADAEVEPRHYIFDDRDPKHYYVYPPQKKDESAEGDEDGKGHLEIVYSATPAEIESEEEVISLDDAYGTALYYYVMHRALLKEGSSVSPQAAMAYYEQFRASVTGRMEGVYALHPEMTNQRMRERARDHQGD